MLNRDAQHFDLIIIGSGMAGLSAAHSANRLKKSVLIIDKGYYTGGRLSSKSLGRFTFNHGVPSFFTANSAFISFLNKKNKNTSLKTVNCLNKEKVFTGKPNMRALIHSLSNGYNILQNAQVTKIYRKSQRYFIETDSNLLNTTEKLIVTAPGPQTSKLILPIHPKLSQTAENVVYSTCWTVFFGFMEEVQINRILELPLLLKDGTQIFVNNTKTTTNKTGFSITVQTSHEWSSAKINCNKAEIIEASFNLLTDYFEKTLSKPEISFAHKWKYAKVLSAVPAGTVLVSKDQTLGVAGDWTRGPSVEDAYTSGQNIVKTLYE